jgi:hypothetical protein
MNWTELTQHSSGYETSGVTRARNHLASELTDRGQKLNPRRLFGTERANSDICAWVNTIFKQIKFGKWRRSKIYAQKLQGSNFDSITSYSDWCFMVFLSLFNRVLKNTDWSTQHPESNTFISCINHLKPKAVVRDSRRVEAKRKLWGEARDVCLGWGSRTSVLLEGSQAMPARHSDKYSVKVKAHLKSKFGLILFNHSVRTSKIKLSIAIIKIAVCGNNSSCLWKITWNR